MSAGFSKTYSTGLMSSLKAAALLIVLAIMAPAEVASAETSRSGAEAKDLLGRAASFYHENGRTKALAEFSRRGSRFAKGDLYVFCIGSDRKLSANGAYREYLHRSADILRDADGNPLGNKAWDVAMKKGDGELRYNWLNPISKLIEPKVSFVARFGEDVCGVGSYAGK